MAVKTKRERDILVTTNLEKQPLNWIERKRNLIVIDAFCESLSL